MKALCLPGAVGELFHPFALCWLFPGAQGAQLHNSSPLWWSQSPLSEPLQGRDTLELPLYHTPQFSAPRFVTRV